MQCQVVPAQMTAWRARTGDLDCPSPSPYTRRMPCKVIIRSASEEELGALGQLKLRSSLGWGDLREELEALPEAREVTAENLPFVFLADHQGEAVGFATVLPSIGRDAELEDLFVDPDFWRRGVGDQLLREAERRALGLGFRGLHVVANRRAVPFYESKGFKVMGEVETLFEPAPEMRKDL